MSVPWAHENGIQKRVGRQNNRSSARVPARQADVKLAFALTPDSSVSRLAPPNEAGKRQTRELARANEELKRANRQLEEFAYVASHDLREPLRMINIYSELLIQQCGANISDEARQYAGNVQANVERMENLIQSVLRYSQIPYDVESELEPISLRQPLESALAIFRERLDVVSARVEVGPLPSVLGGEEQLSLVFQNLLSNSLKYAHPRRRTLVRVRANRKQDGWNISFSDNGIGFEPEFGERIFGLFKRLHGREVPGAGLGLAICRRIIERYGGEIRAEGKPGRGATFIFSLKGPDDHNAFFANTTGRGQSG